MKNSICVLLILLAACKKDNDKAKDYNAIIKNSIWTGEMKYAGKSHVEPFSMNFKADGTFLWHEFSGNLSGTWSVNDQKGNVDIAFSGGKIFSAHITDDNKLSNFEYGQTDWELRNAELNTTTGQVLDNTVWNGQFANGGGTHSITFKPNSKVNVQAYPSTEDQTYSRINGAIRYTANDVLFSFEYFCVLQNNNIIKGIQKKHDPFFNTDFYLPFTVSRQ
jgi:hypothetical protein